MLTYSSYFTLFYNRHCMYNLRKFSIDFHLSQLFILSLLIAYLFEFVLRGRVSLLLVTNSIMFFSLLLFSVTRRIFILVAILLSLLLPLSLVSKGLLKASLLEVIVTSNQNEAIGFYASLPINNILISLLLVLLFSCYLFKRFHVKIKVRKVMLILITLCPLIIFLYKVWQPLQSLLVEFNHINTISLPKDAWLITGKSTSPTYDTYVVVIGESMRKDFMSLYGFNHNTTPFIDKLPKKYITNYIATAVNTSLAVPRVLAKTDKYGVLEEQNNLITLAKKAGYTISWISSQGYVGIFNFSSSRIAKNADCVFFNGNASNDFSLLPEIKKQINTNKKQVIFIHIMGSHEYPCHRLFDYPIKYHTNQGQLVDCYLSTYRKTDDFIKKIYGYLKKSNRTFSLSYFSDHGLNMVKDISGHKVLRDHGVKQSYQVPFFVVYSDYHFSKKVEKTRSAYNYVDFFANWIGVTTNLTKDNYNIFSSKDDKPFIMQYNKQLKKYNQLNNGLSAKNIVPF